MQRRDGPRRLRDDDDDDEFLSAATREPKRKLVIRLG